MKSDDREKDLIGRAAKRLDASLQGIDPQTLERLRTGRQAALAGCRGRDRVLLQLPYWLSPARLSFAAVALLAVSLFAVVPARAPRAVSVDDLEVVTSKEQTAMIEDLDFYRWLAVAGTGRGPEGRGR